MKSIRGQSGFFLLEMLFALMLLTLFAAAMTPLLRNTIRLTVQAEEEHNRMLQTETMLRTLRNDVWNARNIEAATGGIQIRQQSQGIRWKIDGDNIERVLEPPIIGQSSQQWSFANAQYEIEPSRNGVYVKIQEFPDRPSERMHLTSQLLLLQENAP